MSEEDTRFYIFAVSVAAVAIIILALVHGAREGRYVWVTGLPCDRAKHPAFYRVWQIYLLLTMLSALSYLFLVVVDRPLDEPAGLTAMLLSGLLFVYGAAIMAYYAFVGFHTGQAVIGSRPLVESKLSRLRQPRYFWLLQSFLVAIVFLFAGIGGSILYVVVRLITGS